MPLLIQTGVCVTVNVVPSTVKEAVVVRSKQFSSPSSWLQEDIPNMETVKKSNVKYFMRF
ncbi:MAG: hypothetical protein QF371_07960 [Flavobacteriales bacterium]|nr:hypothetical protein [Flavobacteriales bacterium]